MSDATEVHAKHRMSIYTPTLPRSLYSLTTYDCESVKSTKAQPRDRPESLEVSNRTASIPPEGTVTIKLHLFPSCDPSLTCFTKVLS